MYAQHVPLMMTTVEAALKGKLKDSVYPATGQAGGKPQEVSNFLTKKWMYLGRRHGSVIQTFSINLTTRLDTCVDGPI